MPVEEVLTILVAMVLLGGIIAAANYAEREKHRAMRVIVLVSLMVLGVLLSLLMVSQVVAAYSSSLLNDVDIPEKTDAWVALVIAVITTGVAALLLQGSVRERLVPLFPRYEKPEQPAPKMATAPQGVPLFPQMLNYYTSDSAMQPQAISLSAGQESPRSGGNLSTSGQGFNPHSIVHTVALILCIYFLGSQFAQFALVGGLEGVAEDLAEGMSVWTVLMNGVPQIIIPILGVGFGLRRSLRQTVQRLGLAIPTLEEVGIAVGMMVLLLIFVILVQAIWLGLVSDETFEDQSQAAEAVSDSIGTIWMALLVAAMAGVGEEIAFRGALQPVFGLWPTAIFFALFHSQYLLTPASLIILGVAVGFGWLRQRYNTSVAILAHFLYNFVPQALVLTLPEETESWIVHFLF